MFKRISLHLAPNEFISLSPFASSKGGPPGAGSNRLVSEHAASRSFIASAKCLSVLTEGADADLIDAELRAAGRHRSARQLPTYPKRTRKQLVSVATKRRAERTKTAHLSE
jgi:hypothetical protein